MPTQARPSALQLKQAADAEAEAVADLQAFQSENPQVASFAAAAVGSSTKGGAPKSEVEPTAPLPADVREQLQHLIDEQAAAARYVRMLTDLDQQWQQYKGVAHAAYEQRLAAAEARVSNLAQSLHNMKGTPSSTPKLPTVPGYLLVKEGIIVTPSIAVYYIMRITLEAAYQLGGS